jgi:ABC-type branched-subunit amino acid transport system substrate-binding protein
MLPLLASLSLASTVLTLNLTNTAAAASTQKPPILIGQISAIGTAFDNNNDRISTVKAAILAINKAGGIHGRMLKFVWCNDEHDPNTSLACARTMVADHVDVMISDEVSSPSDTGLFAAANIAEVDSEPELPDQFTSSDSFLVSGGANWQVAGVVDEAAKLGLKKVILVVNTGSPYPAIAKSAAAKAKIAYVPPVFITTDQVNFDPTAAQVIASGADAVALIDAPQMAVPIADAILAQGANPTFLFNGDVPSPQDFNEITNISTDKIIVSADTPPPAASNLPGIKEFDQELAAEYKTGDKEALISNMRMSAIRAWLAVHMFAEIADTLKTVTAKTILAAFTKAKNVNGLGLIPPWTPSAKGCLAGNNRVSNPYEWFLKYVGGKYQLLTANEKPVNMNPFICS